MSRPLRVAEALNQALHRRFAIDPGLHLLGVDIADPYGGAFGVTRGLSKAYPDRVRSTPISESAMMGVAAGLALGGDRVLVEVMFGDFVTLCFDQVVNLLTKSVSMYGRRISVSVVIRCPSGGGRGYGPTHSQSLHNHLLGVPHLSVFELSQFHQPDALLAEMFSTGEPCLLVEDKVLYTRPMCRTGVVDGVFGYTLIGSDTGWARVSADPGTPPDCVVVTGGGGAAAAIDAARMAIVTDELNVEVWVPSRLYPLDCAPLVGALRGGARAVVVDAGPSGGWGAQVAAILHGALWGVLPGPVTVVRPREMVIPAAVHLERQVLVGSREIYQAVTH